MTARGITQPIPHDHTDAAWNTWHHPRGETVTETTETTRRADKGSKRRHPVGSYPCQYTVKQGGPHREGCRYISDTQRRAVLKRRRVRRLARASRQANR